jgi:hypothetical protein
MTSNGQEWELAGSSRGTLVTLQGEAEVARLNHRSDEGFVAVSSVAEG